jgi:hypothetical protein
MAPSVRFSDATEGSLIDPPFEGKSPKNKPSSLLVAFRGEDGFWIGAGNFARP